MLAQEEEHKKPSSQEAEKPKAKLANKCPDRKCCSSCGKFKNVITPEMILHNLLELYNNNPIIQHYLYAQRREHMDMCSLSQPFVVNPLGT